MAIAEYTLLVLWLISGGISIVVPLLRWGASRGRYYATYGVYVEYEQQQRAYEEAQNGDNYNNNQYNSYSSCKWYQFSCRRNAAKYNNYNYYYQQASGDNQQNFYAPKWYRMINGKMEGDDREREEGGQMNQGTSGTLKFVYIWTLFMFLALVLFGAMVLWKRNVGGPTALFIMLIVFGQMALLQLLLVGQGVIVTGGRDMEESVYGWYGQLGVLMAYANFWYLIFCFGFATFFGLMACCNNRGGGAETHQSWTSRNLADKNASFRTNATDTTSNNYLTGTMRASAAAAAGTMGALFGKYKKSSSSVQDDAAANSTTAAGTTGSTEEAVTSYRNLQTSCIDIGDQIADITTTGGGPTKSGSVAQRDSGGNLL